MNTFGRIFRLTSFGESHGAAIGGIIDGVPAGEYIDINRLQHQLNRRRPGQSDITTQRNEKDKLIVLSGIIDDTTLGTPIGFMVENSDQRSSDYDNLKKALRPSHADYTYEIKYGIRDHRGGGRASARESISRVVAGAVAMQILERLGIEIYAFTSQIGEIALTAPYHAYKRDEIDKSIVRCPDTSISSQMESLIRQVQHEGDSIGGVITCVVKGLKAGVGAPIFDKLQSRLAAAMMSINAAKGFEYGMGFEGAKHRGSEMNDAFCYKDGSIHTTTNHSGGIQGGISNGEDIYMRIGFKPVATLLQPTETIDINGNTLSIDTKGRHDPCVVPRAVPIVEAMAAMTILDAILLSKTDRI